MKLNTGMDEGQRKEISMSLSKLLADTYSLQLKTQNYHWNVSGPFFTTLHTLFETQYTELFAANDTLAERIRALGSKAPATYNEFLKLTTIKEGNSSLKAMDMVKDLLESHETVIKNARLIFPAAEGAGDEATVDLLTQRLEAHEKAAWMLRMHLEE